MTIYWHFSYQCSTAQQDHEDNESLKPVVLHDPVTGLSKCPPPFPHAHIHIYLTTLKLLHKGWGGTKWWWWVSSEMQCQFHTKAVEGCRGYSNIHHQESSRQVPWILPGQRLPALFPLRLEDLPLCCPRRSWTGDRHLYSEDEAK